jgi:ubiquinone/menaquinone biosynthesis C-methylase UbiE
VPRTLSHAEARAFYDRLGARQDVHRVYEDPALASLIAHGDFRRARAIVEFGAGTGRLAERLLAEALPRECDYRCFDVSPTMVRLAGRRLGRFGPRVRVERTEGYATLPLGDRVCDRFLATYVLDLLSEEDARAVTDEASRVLCPDGLLCLVSLTGGRTCVSHLLEDAWRLAFRMRPQLVGGCRPIRLLAFLGPGWALVHREVVCRWGLCSEVVVVRKA